jgi:hypothetical protein
MPFDEQLFLNATGLGYGRMTILGSFFSLLMKRLRFYFFATFSFTFFPLLFLLSSHSTITGKIRREYWVREA